MYIKYDKYYIIRQDKYFITHYQHTLSPLIFDNRQYTGSPWVLACKPVEDTLVGIT